jgi:hypothetical protein
MNVEERPQLDQLVKSDPYLLLHAVASVNAAFERGGKKPGSEKWQSDTRTYRRMMIDAVIDKWAMLAATDEVFPWHDDYVAEVWVAFRKTTTMKKNAIWDYFDIESPKPLSRETTEPPVDMHDHVQWGGAACPKEEIIND